MRIAHVITRLILGGAQENTILTCEGLRARGHEVALVTGPPIGPEGELLTRARSGGYRVVVIDELRREVSPGLDRRALKALRLTLRELAPQIVHTHSSKAGILGRTAAREIPGAKVVHTVHGLAFGAHQTAWRNWLYKALERRAARRSDAIICVADAMKRQALAARIGRPGQYTTIYSGIETAPFLHRPADADEFRRSLGLPDGAVLVTQVSRLAELKGHEFIIQAAGQLPPHVHFAFVGDGQLRENIEAAIAEARLADRFHLTGLLPPQLIPAVMHASDIVVHCSLREGLARALPQAMLAGKPVVSFDIDGAAEVVDSHSGVLLAPKDVQGLVMALRALSDAPELRQRMGLSGRQRCEPMFDHTRMVARIEEVYAKLLAAR